MGWLRLGTRSAATTQFQQQELQDDLKCTAQHIESISINADIVVERARRPFVSLSIPNEQLPFIPSSEVARQTGKFGRRLWIVIHEIVYDCTEFMAEHPGGDAIIKPFGGAECSWQFWRFHGPKEMEEYGTALRIGRTNGLANKYKEPVRYVGLRKGGLDEW